MSEIVNAPGPQAFAIDCKTCGKKSVTEAECPRCGTELTLLRDILKYSEMFVDASVCALAEKDFIGALGYAQRSWDLVHNIKAAQAALLSCCAIKNYTDATGWFGRCSRFDKKSVGL
jgi:hypothetical protein